ncbi:MAG: hypothetical protein H7Z19_15985 [Chitinophagaceae bacterium]|nr:hypothetical protein [Rubrivivax sp.]
MTAAQAVAHFLKRVGTKRYYLYNGHANWGLLDALEYEAKIPGIRMRHEIHAIHAADVEWRMRREMPVPVTCTTVGPGNFNCIPGIADLELVQFASLMTPAGTPKAVLDTLSAALAKVVALPEVRERWAAIAAEPVAMTPAASMARITAEARRMNEIVTAAQIKAD